MAFDYYILDPVTKTAIPVSDITEWSLWFESSMEVRRVASDDIENHRVSTVFLGLNHNLGNGPPQLFETMIFGVDHNLDQWRCATWKEALTQHAEACKLVQKKPPTPSINAKS